MHTSQSSITTRVHDKSRGWAARTFAMLAVLATSGGCFTSSNGGTSDGGDDGSSADSTSPSGDDAGQDAGAAVDSGADTSSAAVDAGDAASTPDAGDGSVQEAGADAALATDAGLDSPTDAPVLVPGPYTINGSISGQTAPLVLQDDGTDDLTVIVNAHNFHFPTGLAAGEAYAVTVKTQPANQFCAVTGGTGTVGDASIGNVSVACAIAPPNDLTVVAGPESATLTWTAVPGASSYNLYDGPTTQQGQATLGSPTAYGVTTTGTTTLTTTTTGLLPGTDYYFFLTSVASTESLGGSNVVHAVIPPLAPAEVTTTAGNGQATLTWNSVRGATSYDVYYGTSADVSSGTKLTGQVSGVPITGLTNGQLYYFKVSAVDATTEGPLSNEASATPTASLSASIANLVDKGVVHSGVVVGRASGTGLTAVQVSLDSGAYVAATGTANWSFALPSGASTWHDGSLHSIHVRATDGSGYSAVATVSVRKGVNQDVNGDGYADVAVGDPAAGKVSIFESAGPTGVTSRATSAATLTFTGTDTNFGGVVTLGDLNSDGYADVVVGSSYVTNGTNNVYVFQSSGAPVAGAASTAATTVLTGQAAASFGSSLAVGDVDGDGYGDLVVGAEGYTLPVGNAYIFRSSSSGVASGAYTTATTTLTGPTLACNPACAVDEFGAVVAVGDVNGDGYADVAVAALQSGIGYDGVGAVYIFQSAGSAGIPTKTYANANATVYGSPPAGAGSGYSGVASGFGTSMAMADLNGDGYADLVVGAPFAASTNASYWDYIEGAVYGFESAGSSGIANAAFSSAAVTLTAPLPSFCCNGDELGYSVSAGDVNGDGYADVIATTRLSNTFYIFQSQGAPIANTSLSQASTTITGPPGFSSSFGATSVADVNGDGLADVIAVDSSSAYVYESVGSAAIPNGDLGWANAVLDAPNAALALDR